MQSRATRFWLRFDSGARQGEQVPLASGVTTLGRRSDNTIVVNDGSVSGRHAELRVGDSGAELVDLGSTNGTKARGQKITSTLLAPGETFVLGAVRFTFGEAAEAVAPAADAGEVGGVEIEGLEIEGLDPVSPAVAAPDVVASVGAEQVARVRKRSRSAPVLLLLLLAACGVAAWRFWPRRGSAGPIAVVRAVPGNLLEDGSFEEVSESDEEGFASVASAPQGFRVEGSFAASGRLGLGTSLGPGEWAFARSAPFNVPHERRAVLAASVSADAGTTARVGIELSRSDGREGTRLLWSEPIVRVGGEGSFADVELAFGSWTGFDRGRVCVAARSESREFTGETTGESAGDTAGSVAFDDLSVVAGDAPLEAAAVLGEFAAQRVGSAVVIARSGALLLGPIELGRWSESGIGGFAGAAFEVEATTNGFALRANGAGDDPGGAEDEAWVSLRGPQVDEGSEGGASLRIATLGPDGYQSHGSAFERPRASAVLLGDALDLVMVVFAQPVTVRGTTEDGAPWLAADIGAEGSLDVQLSFREERAEATLLDARARAAETTGDFGAALAAWSELLDRVPFEARLVEAASSERAKRLQVGFEALGLLRSEFERGRFFELAELFREVRTRTEALCAAYAGSEVEQAGRALIADIEAELAASGVAEEAAHAERVSAVLGALEAQGFPLLRARVEAELASQASRPDQGNGEERP
jgi:hypothetical protein